MRKSLIGYQGDRLIIIVFLFIVGTLSTLAQTLKGKVVDSRTQEPIIGAVVSVKGDKGAKAGAVTDVDGNFKLQVKNFPTTLVASYTGYNKEEVDVYEVSDEVIQIDLTEDLNGLGEVVVIGYGTQKKSDLTGSVVQLKPEKLNKGVVSSVDQLLQGTTPGLNIQQSSSEPGGGVNVRIRGNSSINAGSSPLYVIDGLPIDNSQTLTSSDGSTASLARNDAGKNPLNALNPADIESIEVLKDASATAIYGSRAANGVILIQTKKGKEGKTRVSYNFEGGWQTAAKKIDVLNAQDYILVMNSLYTQRGQEAPFTAADAARIGKGTNWQDQILHTAFVQNHNLSISGGKDNITYYVSGSYLNQDGIVRNTGTERFTLRVNLEGKINKYLKFGTNLNTSRINDSNFSDGNDLNEQGGPINTALLYDPTEPVYNPDGTLSQSTNMTINNPEILIRGISNSNRTTRTFGNAYLQLEPIQDLKFKLNVGADLNNVRRDVYNSSLTIRGSAQNGIASIASLERTDYLAELTGDYTKELFKNGTFNFLAGTTYQHFKDRTVNAQEGSFPSDEIMTNNLSLGNATTAVLGSDREENALLSYLARVNFNYADKYLLTASVRADGSSRFGENHRWGYFPSFALGWNLHKERFIPNLFDNLKLRLSYGLTGNQDIGNYQSISTYQSGGTFVSGSSYTIGIAPARIANPDLKWESTAQFNVGVDASILKGRLSASFDYFIKKTSDMLIAQPLPTATGYASIYKNLGSLRNSGVELYLNAAILNQRKLKWDVTLNLATVRNKVTDLGGINNIITASIANGGNTSIITVGKPAYSYYGYKVIGIFKDEDQVAHSSQPESQPGFPIFEDVNKDGRIDANDQEIIGDPYPDFTYGIQSNLTWNRFNLSFLINGQVGGQILNGNIIESLYPANYRRNLLSKYALNRWTPEHTDASWPSGTNPSAYGGSPINSLALESATYLRLKFIQLSYDIPVKSLRFLNSASVYVNIQNLFTISPYSGYNPEASTFGESSAHVDLNSYPLARTYSIGLNLTF